MKTRVTYKQRQKPADFPEQDRILFMEETIRSMAVQYEELAAANATLILTLATVLNKAEHLPLMLEWADYDAVEGMHLYDRKSDKGHELWLGRDVNEEDSELQSDSVSE